MGIKSISKVLNICFSPTGATKKAAEILISGLGLRSETELVDISDPDFQKGSISVDRDDLCVLALPSFKGRAPAEAMERLEMIDGNNALMILLCSYGNREYEDTLLEMRDGAVKAGFIPVAGVAAVTEHSKLRSVAKGRPDNADGKTLAAFAEKIFNELSTKEDSEYNLFVPGNYPYKVLPESYATIVHGGDCLDCEACLKKCPVRAIYKDKDGYHTGANCIGCMRCVAICPKGNRRMTESEEIFISKILSDSKNIRKEYELFL